MKRRSYLKTIGVVGSTTAVGVGNASASPPEELQEFYKSIKRKYGAKEAKASTRIVAENNERRRRGEISEQEAFDATTSAILDHPHIENGKADLTRYLDNKQAIGTAAPRPDGSSGGGVSTTSGELDSGGSGGGNSLVLDSADTNKDAAYNAEAHVAVDTTGDRIRTFANASGYGGSYAVGRLYGKYTAGSTGQYDITADYYRKGFCDQGSTKIAIYTRKEGYGIKDKVTEEVTSTRDGTISYTKGFNLEGGYTYEIGMQVKSEVSDHATAGSYADFYYDGREVDVNEMTYDYIG